MVYICADDYGLCHTASENIKKCLEKGALNKVSVFPNFDAVNLEELLKDDKNKISLHLNLVEGKCMSDSSEIPLLADKEGKLKNTFTGLFKLNLLKGKLLEAEAYREIKAQVLFWKSILPKGADFLIDTHQHTHMIPAVFRALLRVLKDEKINVKYLRIPVESVLPYIKTPSLYFTYSFVNIIKAVLLNFLWLFNKKEFKKYPVGKCFFFGVLFSGNMDKRVNKILPHYIKMAKKKNLDIELLFHPGYVNDEDEIRGENIVFKEFYTSENRKTEFNTVMNLSI